MDEFQKMAEDNKRWNDSLTPWGIVTLVLLVIYFFLPTEGMIGVIKIATFYLMLLILELLFLFRMPARIAQMEAGFTFGATKGSMVFAMILLAVGVIAIPYGLIRCGLDLVQGPDRMTVYNVSVTRSQGNKTPTTYDMHVGYERYKISSDTYWELKEKKGQAMEIVVYPHTKVLDSYKIVE